jgi:hypothetical protein
MMRAWLMVLSPTSVGPCTYLSVAISMKVDTSYRVYAHVCEIGNAALTAQPVHAFDDLVLRSVEPASVT